MGLEWNISQKDIEKTVYFVREYGRNAFVMKRIKDNVAQPPPSVSREIIWEVMFDCLLSTRQRSGPDSPIAKFLNLKPFPLPYDVCANHSDAENFIREQIAAHKSIQYKNRIAEFAAYNLNWLQNDGWNTLDEWLLPLIEQRKKTPEPTYQKYERLVAHHFDDTFKGIGPKQSRNFLQLLGLVRYEIPLDSRFMKWLINNGFPLFFDGIPIHILDKKIINQRITIAYWYDSILDKIQELCRKVDILPVVLDACVFTSFDEG